MKQNRLTKEWQMKYVQNGDDYYSEYYKEITKYNINIKLDFTDDFSYEDFAEVSISDVIFYATDNDNILKIKDIPKRLYSEIYYELKTIVDSGSRFNPE